MLLQASYSIRIDERVGEIQIELVAMQTGRKSGRVGIPVKDVEGRRLIAKQIVVDRIIPDQIVRSASMRTSAPVRWLQGRGCSRQSPLSLPLRRSA